MVFIAEIGSSVHVPVPVDDKNFLSRQMFERYFPEAVGLYFEENGEKIPVKFDKTEMKLVPPSSGWENKVFYVVRPSYRPQTSMNVESRPATDYMLNIDSVKDIIEGVGKFEI